MDRRGFGKFVLLPVLAGLALAVLMWVPASAETWTFEDTYIGTGAPDRWSQNGGDVVSADGEAAINEFDIDSLTVEVDDSGWVEITLMTDFYPDVLGQGTDYGDLFISAEPYSEDTVYDPDTVTWEYVFDTDTGDIFSVSDGTLLYSDDTADANNWSDNTYREDQLVGFEADEDAQPVATGEFDDSEDGLLVYAFNLSDLGLSEDEGVDLAFRWSMTCANDVIQVGGISVAPVPEPATMMLLGCGLLAGSAVGRKSFLSG